ncbi:MAG: response regulator [Chitinispirillia bacterium]|nr:response regulator [Chitinispirillia bacterium]MCL2268195.1 response regulator [Chitinispirillia bacterium]
MKTIFIVDDNTTNQMTAKTALDGVYRTFALPSAAKMFSLAEKITPDLILLDVEMPEMDGFEAISILKSDAKLRFIPVIFLTAKHDAAAEIRGFEMGALDFIYKPFSPPVLIKRLESHIETDNLIKQSLRSVRAIHNATISVIANMVECRDKITGGHIERTQKYLEILLKELVQANIYADTILKWDMSILLPSAQLHDVGKITISDIILNKPGKLTDDEFALIKTHCSEGERVIDEIMTRTNDNGFLLHARRFAGHHHEKWNGTGYPRGLRGDDIPLEGRIMAVADVYDALVSERPYKKPFTHEEAVEIIKKDTGTHFDPKIAEAFMNAAENFEAESTAISGKRNNKQSGGN